jgi:hypothetical protein
LSTEPELSVDATGIGLIPVRLMLPQAAAQTYRGQTVPIYFTVQTQVEGKDVTTHEKSTFYVPR